ncbi:MAG: hydrogenase [Lachnospiraceae bacterium]|nr:hydrogenase [Lachnospiraceae bacterium]
MSYKIAVASSDGLQIDETFGAAKSFIIYEAADGIYRKLEERTFREEGTENDGISAADNCNSSGSCKTGGGCGAGAGGGCGGAGGASEKVELISDCRCVVCKKIGFHIQKQLERKAISVFDVSVSVEEALEKISHYFTRMDNHESLRVQK